MDNGIRFSPEQQRAIYTAGNVIVSAGAGSGKTTVMIERIIEKLKAGARLDKMLIVTFTRAAAADIRVKLAARLTKLKNSGEAAAVAEEALLALPVCNIGTLHSFCQRLIKVYFQAAELDPDAVMLDDTDARAYLSAAVRTAVRDRAEKDGDFALLCDALSSRRDLGGAERAVENALGYAMSLVDPHAYLASVPDDKTCSETLKERLGTQRAQLGDEVGLLLKDIGAGLSATQDRSAPELLKLQKAAEELLPYADGVSAEISPVYYRAKGDFCDVIYERFKALKAECEKYTALREDAKTAESCNSAVYAAALCGAAADALKIYEARKAALGRIDYSDLEHGAYRVLTDEKCLQTLKDEIDYVFIDEYQDVNPLQDEIARRLKNGTGAEMFLVGDVKQSIYGFRRCDPKYFKKALDDDVSDYTKVFLKDNYRSARQVIDFVNKVFTGVMTESFGYEDYSKNKLVCMRGDDGEARFCALPAKKKRTAVKPVDYAPYSVKNALKSGEKLDAQAEYIVGAIADYIDEKAEDGKPLHRYGDVAVLLRAAQNGTFDAIVAALRKNGIPVTLGKKSQLSDYPEALALLDIARCVDNRFDDIALYTAMRSPMGGFSDGELYAVARDGEARARALHIAPAHGSDKKSYCFWQKVKAYRGELSGKLKAFDDRRESFCGYSQRHDAADTLGYITSEIDYFQHVFENGGSAAAVEALIADAADKNVGLGAYLASVADGMELAAGDGGDAVTVTTIHSSKGLEYDFVIVANVDKTFNSRDASQSVIPAPGGVTVRYPDIVSGRTLPSAPWLISHLDIPDKLKAEELRLFYVALTRAKRRLLVLGRERNTKYADPSSEYDFMRNILPYIDEPAERETEESEEAAPPLSAAITDAVKEICGFTYPATELPIKTCVTAIADMSGEDYTAAAPVLTEDDAALFGRGDGSAVLSGVRRSEASEAAMRRGTAYHSAMERLDIYAPDAAEAISRCVAPELVDAADIARAGEVIRELAKDYELCFKERYFIVDMPLSELDIKGEGSVLVQGVIDLLLADGSGNAVIVDYKTTAPEHILNDGYKLQLRLYKAAVERTTRLKVRKTYLYSFVLGKLFEV